MLNCCPVALVSACIKGRAKASVPPPGGNGTSTLTGLLGQLRWPLAGKAPAKAAAGSRKAQRRMRSGMAGLLDA
jgi:hypothetical protein